MKKPTENQDSSISTLDKAVLAVFLVVVSLVIILTKDTNPPSQISSLDVQLQKSIETVLDTYKKELGADEIIVSVMESKTGNILSLVSSNSIKVNDKNTTINNAIEFTYEPGSVIKPITIALALDKNRATLQEEFPAYNDGKKNKDGEFPRGVITIDRWKISDDHQFKKNTLTIEDIVVNSSSIGTLLVANRLSGKELMDGFHQFGIASGSGIDLPNEKMGYLPTLTQLSAGEEFKKLNIFKSTVSYGQGMTTTFMELLKAYNVFNNDGKIITPSVVKKDFTNTDTKILSDKTTAIMKELLIKTVLEGTGKNTIYEGLEIGGKTGTANIAINGEYKQKYMSSFFGFANDSNKKYTIGVVVNNPTSTGEHWYYYYASNSAVPVFKEVVDILVKDGYLQPNGVKK
jgi:cell division protein FtsI (penicillin-binding protein 3)